jgi:hypothetical protein
MVANPSLKQKFHSLQIKQQTLTENKNFTQQTIKIKSTNINICPVAGT